MPSIRAFADELARIRPNLGEVQANKHLYRYWRDRLLETGEAPFLELAIGERLGPYFPALRSYTVGRSNEQISPSDGAVLAAIAEEFDGLSGKELARQSHEEYLEWGFTRLGLKPTQRGNKAITPELATALSALDRLAIEGNNIKVSRPDNSVEELVRSMEQVSVLQSLGAKFDQLLIEAR